MDVKINHLESFVAVAQLHSFTQAAKLLHMSQPALTVHIHQLESCLSVRLLNRDTRSVRLTDVGRAFLPAAQRLVKDLETLVSNAKSLSVDGKGTVRVAAMSSVSCGLLPVAIARFREQYPAICVEIREAFAAAILDLVRSDEVDFGIASYVALAPDMAMSFLYRDRLCAVFAPEMSLTHKTVIRIRDLVDLPLILMNPETSNRALVNRAFESIGHLIKPTYEVTRHGTAIALAEAGLGVAILPSSLLKNRHDRRLQFRPIQHAMFTREIGVIQKIGRTLPPECEAFLIFLKASRKSLGLETGLKKLRH
jgi:DNA-binding transcriptional LysR family regulator